MYNIILTRYNREEKSTSELKKTHNFNYLLSDIK